MKRIGLWIRVSTEDQVRGESPEHHEERGRAYALAKGWQVVEVYKLDAVSGKSVRGLPEAQRMIEDVRRGHVQALVFSKLARLARNTRELLEFAEEFQRHGADLISLQESIDTSTAAGRLFYTILAAVAQWEREETSERVAASVPVRARLGKATGGKAVYGYQWVDGRLIPHPEEAEVRRLIYELYRKHKRKKTVAGILNERGYRTRRGELYSPSTVGRLITDTTAKGVRTANRCKSLGDGKSWRLKPESEWVAVPVEPIVDAALWNECNAIFRETSSKYRTHRGRKPVNLFSGVMFCGACGAGRKMYRQTGWDKYRCYKCPTKISQDDIEAIFIEQLSGFLLSKERVAAMLEKSREEASRQAGLADKLERDRGACARQADALIELFQKGALTVEEFRARHEPVRQRAADIETELGRIAGDLARLRLDTQDAKEAMKDGLRLQDEWPRMAFERRRQVVEALVERITVDGNEVELSLNYLPGALAVNSDRNRRD